MKKILSIAVLSLILTACGQETGSYAMIVIINDIEHGGTEEKLDAYEIDKMIGKITKKVPANVFPANNQSNFFEEGTIVYSVKDKTEFIIVEDLEGQKHLLQRAPGDNNE